MSKFSTFATFASASVAVLLSSASASAKTIFVDANGNNGAAGTQQSPYKEIGFAVSKAASGDVVSVNSGNYSGGVQISKSNITLQATPGQMPMLKGGIDVTGNYVNISGLNISGAENGIATKAAHHINIIGNVVHDNTCNGIGSVQGDYITIKNNVTYRNAFTSPWQCSGISVYQPRDIDTATGFKIIVSDNLSYENENKVKPNGGGNITDGNGIILDDYRNTQKIIPGPKAPYKGATLVENNIVFNNGGRGVHVFETDNATVRNNTSYKNLKTPGMGKGSGEINIARADKTIVSNNIAVSSDPSNIAFIDSGTNGSQWNNNIAYNGRLEVGKNKSNAVFANNNIVGQDPQLLSPDGGNSASNFALKPTSPALNTGSVDKGSPADILGKKRPSGANTDMGAIEN